MAARILLASLLFSVVAGAADKDPKQDPKFLKDVEESIARGVEWLLAKQTTSGKFPAFGDTRGEVYELGMHALSTLAVMKGLGDPDAKPVRKALKVLRNLYTRHRNTLKTYEVGITLMVLDAKYHTDPRPKPGKLRRPKKQRRGKFSDEDLALAKELVVWLQRKQRPGGFWRYPENGQDLSNTQYAALGLWSAHRMGVKIHPGVITRMMDETLRRQQKKGQHVPFIPDARLHKRGNGQRSASTIEAKGWRYLPEERFLGVDGKIKVVAYPYSGSMTTAGIAVLAIGRDILGKKSPWMARGKDAFIRKAMWEGFAWLQINWDLYDNPGQPGNWPFYWIYGLERAARLGGIEHVGIYDWYHQGSVRLMDDQKPDGAWPKTQRMRPPGGQNVRWWSDQVDTCFAILFLTRSTPEIKTPPPAITTRKD